MPITVDWETRAGSAEADVDYTEASGTPTFAAGDTTTTIAVVLLNDAIHEFREDFTVHLSGTDDALVTLGRSSTIGGIADLDRVAITMEGATVAEDAGTVTLTLTASAPASTAYTVDYTTEDGTAEAGTDYTAASGTVMFAAGVTERTVTVTVLEDAVDDDGEDFKVRLSEPTGSSHRIDLPADPASVQINDDANVAPSFSSSATFDAAENQTPAGTVLATDSDAGDDVTGYAITGGADQAFFSIGGTDGALTFKTAPNFEDAKDSDTDNDYVVEVQATSGAGEREKTATQTVTVTVTDVDTEAPGKPAAPTVTAASATSLSVSWSAPANAGPAITDYDHRHRTSPAGSWTEVTGTTSTALSATIAGLAEGTSYDVQVRATNDEGTGAWSDSGTESTDANAAPSFDSPAAFDAAENQTAAGRVVASDDDTGDSITDYDDHRRRGPGVLLDRGDLRGADVQDGAELRGRRGFRHRQRLRGGGAGHQRRGRAREDGDADDHGDGDRREHGGAGQAGRAERVGGVGDQPERKLVGAGQRRPGDHPTTTTATGRPRRRGAGRR